MQDEVIVTCALTGVLATREQCPWVPYTPVEIAEEARRAYEAGAAVVHIHARTDTGAATYDPAVYAKIRGEVEARCPVILNFSTGGLGAMEGRVAHIREVKPALAALNHRQERNADPRPLAQLLLRELRTHARESQLANLAADVLDHARLSHRLPRALPPPLHAGKFAATYANRRISARHAE